MLNQPVKRDDLEARLLELHGGDPFAHIIAAATAHRRRHGRACGLYPADPQVMRLAHTLVRASGARRILDLGTGFGYSALWLASAAPPGARVDAVDQFEEHLIAARKFVAGARLADRVQFIAGDVHEVLRRLEGPYDLVHDDAWFGAQPAYFERVLDLLRPGGILSMPSWFLLLDALKGTRHRRWAQFAGEQWEQATLEYAQRLSANRRLHVTWTVSPPLGIAIKR